MAKPSTPIEALAPGTDLHAQVLKLLMERLEASERAMADFYARWQVNERKAQAYISLPNYEELIAKQNQSGKPPQVVSLIVPYSWAVTQTITTYLLHTFCGRSPIFQVGTYNSDLAQNARNLETLLQYNAAHTKLVWQIYQGLQNSQIYQIGAWKVGWKTEKSFRTRYQQLPQLDFYGAQVGMQNIPTREHILTYSGNDVESIDPFLFFPDPRVPMTEVNRKGEFVFWRSFLAKIKLQEGEMQGWYKHVNNITAGLPVNRSHGRASDRSLRSMGQSIAGGDDYTRRDLPNAIQVDEGSVTIIPKEWGLSDTAWPEKWLFTVANKQQIIRAEPLEADHDLHPVCVIEPNALGTQFGSLATIDIVGPLQDHISWLLNSHMQNVRTAINNRLVVNPHVIHMEDLKKDPTTDDSAWIVRMKQSAFGLKPADGLFQLQVADMTTGHIKAIETMMRVGQMLTGTNENLMGMQDSRGRKTATEVRTSGEAGASRLAAGSRIMSAQGISDLPMMMGMNLQQRLDVEFYQRVIGKFGDVPLTPAGITGDFYYPIHDGTLPLDRVALANVWKEILLGVAQDAELRQTYSFPKMFSFVAELAGAGNIETFKLQPMPDAAVANAAAAGKIMPMPQM